MADVTPGFAITKAIATCVNDSPALRGVGRRPVDLVKVYVVGLQTAQ